MERPRKPNMTNRELAERLELTHSAVSRIRNGTRTPSLHTMLRIETAMDWSINQQITAKVEDVYAPYFEEQIARLANG